MPEFFDFEVVLREILPKIWRGFLLRKSATFEALHDAIQVACGWTNSHLYRFEDETGDSLAGTPDDECFEADDPDASLVKLSTHLGPKKGDRVVYVYDFGDTWEHDVILHGVVEDSARFKRRLLAGARAFPPDDCGSTPGYRDCVRVALGKKKDPELKQWMGDWHPERFDLVRVKTSCDR